MQEKNKQFHLGKRMAVIVITANRADIIDDYLFALGESYDDAGVDCIIFDGSDNNDTKKVVEKWNKRFLKDNREFLFYKKYNATKDIYSIDQKVIDACNEYADKYEYLWLQRDRLGILFNNCLENLYNILAKNPDIIAIYNSIDEKIENCNSFYKDCREFFKDYYAVITTLGQYIFKSSFIKSVIEEIPLDEKTYSLYFPTAVFHYIANREFLAANCSGSIFKYHRKAITSRSHWYKFFFKQWFEFMYKTLVNLPEIYRDLVPVILKKWNERYKLCHPVALLYLHKDYGISKDEIDRYARQIPFISTTPLSIFYKISEIDFKKESFKNLLKIIEDYGKEVEQNPDITNLGKLEKEPIGAK